MERKSNYLDILRAYEIEKYDTEKELSEELDRLIVEKYNGDFSTFMKEEVLTEDYGDLKYDVERLYNSIGTYI